MNKRNLYLIVLVLLLLVSIVILYKNDRSTLISRHTDFSFETPYDIDSFIIQSRDKKIVLSQTGQNWKANDQQADMRKIKVLTETIKNLQVLTPASAEIKKRLIKSPDSELHTVYVFKKNKQIYTLHFAFIDTRNIAYLRKPDQIYVIAVRGFGQINLTRIIPVNEAYWQENVLINYVSGDIVKIEIKYPLKADQNFILEKTEKNTFHLITENQQASNITPDNKRISDYLHFFHGITYQDPDTMNYKPIIHPNSLIFTLQIKDINNVVSTFSGYPLFNAEQKKVDLYHLGIIATDGKLVYMKYEDFDPLLISPDFFIKQD